MVVDRRALTAAPTWRVAGIVGVVVCSVLVLPLLDPGLVGLGATTGYLHLLSFRLLTGLALLMAALVVAATLFRRTGTPLLRMILIGVLVVVGGFNVVTVTARGWSGPIAAESDLVVLALNTQGGATTADEVVQALLAHDVAAAALPETMPADAQAVVTGAARAGVGYQLFLGRDGTGIAQTTALLIRDDLGPYRQVSAPFVVLGAARAEPVSGSGPAFVAVHPVAPVTSLGLDAWVHYAGVAADECRTFENTVVFGDFNATLDHPPLRDLGRCADAAAETGRGGEGTWPSTVPAPFAAPIDHVVYDATTLVAVGSWTETVGGTDHRALFAQLDRLDPTEEP